MWIPIISFLIAFITGCSFDNTYKSDIYDRDYIKMVHFIAQIKHFQ